MFFLRIKGLLIACFIGLCLSCSSNKLPVAQENIKSTLPERRAYVVLRSAGEAQALEKVKGILSSDFLANNVATNFSLYKAKQGWNQNRIFQTAYNGQYDYIILIDQVAKITIDGRTQVGGKYQLRSYHVKSPSPDWLDLGQSTCNITVKPSIQKFSREIVRGIVGNSAVFKDHDFNYDDAALASSGNTNEYNVGNGGDTSDLTSEIERLKKELEAEKQRTQLAQQEKKRIKEQLELQLEAKKQSDKLAEIESKAALQKDKLRQKDITETYARKREEIRNREAEETLRNPVVVDTEPKELTREERLVERRNAKRRQAELKAEQKRKVVEEALKRKVERQQLAVQKRNDQIRIREELEAQRDAQRKAADHERLTKRRDAEIAEQDQIDAKRKADALAAQASESKKRLAAQRIAEQKQAEETRLESQIAAERKFAEERRLATQQEAQEKERLAEARQLEQQRLANERRRAQEIAEQERRDTALAAAEELDAQRKADELERQREDAEQLAEQKRLAEVKQLEQQSLANERRRAQEIAEQERRATALAEAEELEEQRRVDELERQRKDAEQLAEQKRLEELQRTKQEKALETNKENQRIKERDVKRRLTEQWKKEEQEERQRLKQQSSNKKRITSDKSENATTQPNALIIIRGKESDEKMFEDLKDHLEFDFMFAKAKAQTLIFNPEQSLSLTNIEPNIQKVQNRVIIIDQVEYLGDGKSSYQIKTLNRQANEDWIDLGTYSYNLGLKEALKQISKEVTNSLKN